MKFDSPAGLSKDGQYQRVEESDGQNEKSCSSEEDRSNLQMFAEAKRRQGRKLWAGFIICLTAVLLTSSAASIYYARHTSSSELMHCGSSPEEAEELGCKFDLMTYGWIHPNCYNASLSAEWQAEWGPWEWRSEKNGTKETEIPPEALPYQRVVYGSQGYHELHCLYSFKLVHLAGLNGYLLSSEAGPISHTDHCIMTIAKPQTLDLESINTRIRNLYTQCVKLR